MITKKTKRAIIINVAISVMLLMVFAAIFYFITEIEDQSSNEISKIKSEANALNAKTRRIEGKIKDAKKYKKIWEEIEDRKKSTKAIKIDDVNTVFKKVAKKHNVTEYKIKIALPTEVKTGFFKRESLKTLVTSGSLNFKSYYDIDALKFAEEFSKSLPGNFIITSLSLKKEKSYEKADLLGISRGKTGGGVSANVEFVWYTYRDKEKKKEKLKNIRR